MNPQQCSFLGGTIRCLKDEGHSGRHRHNDEMALDLVYVEELGYWLNINEKQGDYP